MQASVLIVSRNRKEELKNTLVILEKMLDFQMNEVLVFLDGCTDNSELLKEDFKWVQWYLSSESMGASAARNKLYPYAKGEFLIGLDDDAHPLSSNFIFEVTSLFEKYPNVGIIAFEEIKGKFISDDEALAKNELKEEEYYCNEFIGCGFSIRKDVYKSTNGFPVWVDIYGEESCVAIEVLANGYDILYSSAIKVNHRVDMAKRKLEGKNYFRFGKQLKNSTYYFLVYYPFPVFKILKMYLHNFKKYAVKDFRFFKIFFRVIIEVVFNIPKVLRYRKPVDKKVLLKIRSLSPIRF